MTIYQSFECDIMHLTNVVPHALNQSGRDL